MARGDEEEKYDKMMTIQVFLTVPFDTGKLPGKEKTGAGSLMIALRTASEWFGS